MADPTPHGRIPPHNADAERTLLGALLLEPQRIPDAAERVREGDFFDPRHNQIFSALVSLTERRMAIDLVSIGEALTAAGQFQKIGGKAYLIELSTSVTSGAHVVHHARIVAETAMLRRLIQEAGDIVSEAFETRPDGESVQKLVDLAEHRIFQLNSERDASGASSIESAIQEAFKRIDSASHRTGLTGLASGYHELDEMLCGFNKEELIVVAARPSMGKTAFVLNLIENAALNPGDSVDHQPVVLFYSLEMGQQSIVSRMLCSRARVDAHRLRTGRIPTEDYSELTRAAGELSASKIFIDDTPGISVMSLRSRARRIQARHGLDMIVVDYLQLMTHPKSESRQQEISQISRSLKELARELKVPVIALSQLSRQVENRDDKRPQLSDLRESGSIEQDADVVLLLFRPEYYNPTEENRGLAEVICAKQRNGPTGTVRLSFQGSILRFENRAPTMDQPFQT